MAFPAIHFYFICILQGLGHSNIDMIFSFSIMDKEYLQRRTGMNHTLVNLIDISKSFGDQVILDELNLSIRENEFLTLLLIIKRHIYIISD